MNTTSILLLIGLLFCLPSISAQQIDWEFGFSRLTPTGNFQQKVDKPLNGLHMAFLGKLRNIPIKLGAGIDYSEYGKTTYSDDFGLLVFGSSDQVKTKNKLLAHYFIVRIEPESKKLNPFIEAITGFNYFHTTSVLQETISIVDYLSEEERRQRTRHMEDVVLRFGMRGGTQLSIWKNWDNESTFEECLLFIKAGYDLGGTANYLDKNDIEWSEHSVDLYPRESRTDMLSLTFGLILRFK